METNVVMPTSGSHPTAKGDPLVSFVIPVFNCERFIARCLLAIRTPMCPEGRCEVVIVDNGSTDGTQAIMKRLGFDFEVVPRVNVSVLRNLGVKRASGRYVAFVDSDVEVSPGWLEAGLAALEDPEVVVTGCFPGVPDEATWIQRTWDLHQRCRRPAVEQAPVPWLSTMNLLVRRADFLEVGGFNEALESAEDVDLCFRLKERGTLLYNPAMQAVHWGEASDLRTFWKKEVWRGKGNLKGMFAHGLRMDEVPSVGFPLYVMTLLVICGTALFTDLNRGQLALLPFCLLLLGLPATYLAAKTAWSARRLKETPKLFLLYLVYGFARAYALMKGDLFARQRGDERR